MRALKTLFVPLAVLLVAHRAAAQKIDFHEYNSPITREYPAAIGDPVTAGGLDFYSAIEFSAANTADNALGTWGYADPGAVNRPVNLAPGATTLFAPLGAEVDILKAGTDAAFGPYPFFGITSIDVAQLYSAVGLGGGLVLAPYSVTIFGSNGGPTAFSQTFNLQVFAQPILQTLALDARFLNVNNVWFVQGTGSGRSYQFTNVVATPEPSSMVLLASGLSGVFGFARRRRKNVAIA